MHWAWPLIATLACALYHKHFLFGKIFSRDFGLFKVANGNDVSLMEENHFAK